jgi:uncharacterized glyoxalase superfamily protein PhnB
MAPKAIPDEYGRVQPYLVVNGAAGVIDFMKTTFGAQERGRMPGPNGTIGHAEMLIGDSVVMLADAGPESPPMPATMVVYVEDCDATYKRALAAGGTSAQEPQDMFYGDRAAGVFDATGNRWWIHTHIEDVSPEEMERRAAAARPQG